MGTFYGDEGLKNRKSIDITHAHYVFPSGMLSLLLKKVFGIPYIVTAHGGDIERMAKKNARIRNWTASILRESAHVIAVGPVLAQQIEQDFEIAPKKFLLLVWASIVKSLQKIAKLQYVNNCKLRKRHLSFYL